MLRRALTAALAVALLGATAAVAETGGSGFLPRGFPAPSEYGTAKGPRGLQLLEPPAKLPCNTGGEAGTVRFYGGAHYTPATNRKGVGKLRVALHSASGKLITHLTFKPAKHFQNAYLDRLGPGTRCGTRYSIRYSYRLDGKRPARRRSFDVSVAPAT